MKLEYPSHYISKINYFFYKLGFLACITLALSVEISTAGTTISFSIIYICFLLTGEWKKKFILLKNPVIVIAITFWLWILISGLLGSASFHNSWAIIGKYSKVFLIWALLYFIDLQDKRFYIILIACITGIVANILAIYINYFILPTQNAIVFNNPGWPSPQNHFVFAFFTLVFSFGCFIFATSKKLAQNHRIALLLVGLIALVAEVFLNSARTGYVMELAVIIILYTIRYRLKGLIYSILFACALFFTAYNISPIFQQRVDAAASSYVHYKAKEGTVKTSTGLRMYYNEISFGIIKDDPYKMVLGNGSGSYPWLASQYVKNHQSSLPKLYRSDSTWNPENQYVLLTIENGVVGLILFLSIFLAFIIYCKKNCPYNYYLLSICLSIGMLVGCLFSSWFRDLGPSVLFLTYCSLIMSSSKKNHKVS